MSGRVISYVDRQAGRLLASQHPVFRAGDWLFRKAFGNVQPPVRPAFVPHLSSLVPRDIRPVLPHILLVENGSEKFVAGKNGGSQTVLPVEATAAPKEPTAPPAPAEPKKTETPPSGGGKPNKWILRGGIAASAVLFAGITLNPFVGPLFIGSLLFGVGAGFSALGAIGILASNLLLLLPGGASIAYHLRKTRQAPKTQAVIEPPKEITPPPPTGVTFTSDSKAVYTVTRGPMQGGMAKVYIVKGPNDQIYALKIFSPQEGEWEKMDSRTKSECRSRFEQEVVIMRELRPVRSPHIVQFIDEGVDNGRRFYVMEFAPHTFSDLLMPTAPAAQALQVAFEAACGLRDANSHKQRFVHRDLKPGNILITESPTGDRQAKVSDFGLGRPTEGGLELTTTHARFGTWNYLDPEVIEKGWKGADALLADIYALGVTLFRAIEGKPPVEVSSPPTTTEACKKQADAVRKDLSELKRPSTMSEDVFAVIRKMTHPDPKQRYQSWNEVIAALKPLLPKTGDETFAGKPKDAQPTSAEKPAAKPADLFATDSMQALAGEVGAKAAAGKIKGDTEPPPTPSAIQRAVAKDEAGRPVEPSTISATTQMLEAVEVTGFGELDTTDPVINGLFSREPATVKASLAALAGTFAPKPEDVSKLIGRVNELMANPDLADDATSAMIALAGKIA